MPKVKKKGGVKRQKKGGGGCHARGARRGKSAEITDDEGGVMPRVFEGEGMSVAGGVGSQRAEAGGGGGDGRREVWRRGGGWEACEREGAVERVGDGDGEK
jgi:hypothetical protein